MSAVTSVFSATIPAHVLTRGPEDEHDEITVKFSNGIAAVFPKEVIGGLEYFSRADGKTTFELPTCDLSTLQLIVALADPKNFLADLIRPEGFSDPNLFEYLEKQFTFFCPSTVNSILNRITEELKYMSLESAKAIMAKYNASAEKKRTFLVGVAEETIRNSFFFSNEKEASEFFIKLQKAHLDHLRMFFKLERNQEKLPLTSPYLEYLTHQANYIRGQFQKLKKEITAEEANPVHLGNMMAAAVTHPAFEEIAAVCEKTKKVHDIKVIKALCDCQDIECPDIDTSNLMTYIARLNRDDLMPYIIGPKARLYDYYNLKIHDKPRQKEYPFYHESVGRTQFGYRLENDSIYEFEEEIRKDLTTYDVKLPPRIVQENVVSIPLTEEQHAQQVYFASQFKKWSVLTEEEQKAVFQKMLDLTGWLNDHPALKVECIIDFEPPAEFSKKAEGKLEIYGREFTFNFCLTNLTMILFSGRSVNPDTHSSKCNLDELKRYYHTS